MQLGAVGLAVELMLGRDVEVELERVVDLLSPSYFVGSRDA